MYIIHVLITYIMHVLQSIVYIIDAVLIPDGISLLATSTTPPPPPTPTVLDLLAADPQFNLLSQVRCHLPILGLRVKPRVKGLT